MSIVYFVRKVLRYSQDLAWHKCNVATTVTLLLSRPSSVQRRQQNHRKHLSLGFLSFGAWACFAIQYHSFIYSQWKSTRLRILSLFYSVLRTYCFRARAFVVRWWLLLLHPPVHETDGCTLDTTSDDRSTFRQSQRAVPPLTSTLRSVRSSRQSSGSPSIRPAIPAETTSMSSIVTFRNNGIPLRRAGGFSP
mmetsp:Transcript_14668/g.40773  ORF Transcript_14668/g.40773 Transcript_14668/m.40773 type:complete len:192 (+) Transcript_14668:2181-2756(+)